jgi:hypothetical protein
MIEKRRSIKRKRKEEKGRGQSHNHPRRRSSYSEYATLITSN